jgi:CCR4-NOT transcription complex subunit 1
MARLNSSASHGKVVEELGYTCTGSKAHLKEVLSLLPTLDETSAAQLVATMARTHSGLEDNSASYSSLISALGGGQHSVPEVPPSTWSYEVAVDAIREVVRRVYLSRTLLSCTQPLLVCYDTIGKTCATLT